MSEVDESFRSAHITNPSFFPITPLMVVFRTFWMFCSNFDICWSLKPPRNGLLCHALSFVAITVFNTGTHFLSVFPTDTNMLIADRALFVPERQQQRRLTIYFQPSNDEQYDTAPRTHL